MTVYQIPEIYGRIVSSIEGGEEGSEELKIHFNDGGFIRFYHEQDCCEQVYLEDVCGDFSCFVGQPVTLLEERQESPDEPDGTWTFYELGCPKGTVTLRWFGISNGWYSEEVDIEIKEGTKNV